MSGKRGDYYIGLDQYAGVDDGTEFGHYARILRPEFERIMRWATRKLEPGELRNGKGYYPTDLQALAFRYRVAGHSVPEIALIMECDQKTVRDHLSGALKKLRKLQGVGLFTVMMEEIGPEAGPELMGQSNWSWFENYARENAMANRTDSPATRKQKKGTTA